MENSDANVNDKGKGSDRMRSFISALSVVALAAFFALLLFCTLPTPVLLAAEVEERIETVDIAAHEYPTTCLFSIGWEQGDLFSTLIAPDGTRYPEDVPVKGITIAKQEGITILGEVALSIPLEEG